MLTVITASYNSASSIEETINSILNQTINGFQYIIVDGKSKDNTVEIIKSYVEKFKDKNIQLKWISESDKGIYDAWNKGLQLADGDWISFLGSDDIYCKNALEIYKKEISNDKNNIELIYSNVQVVKGNKKLRVINGTWSWPIFKRYMNIAHVGSFHSKKYFKKYGIFDISYKICGDYELLLRAKDKIKIKKIEEITAYMEYGGVSNNINKVFKETFKAKNKTAQVEFILCLYDYILAYLKYFFRKIKYAIT